MFTEQADQLIRQWYQTDAWDELKGKRYTRVDQYHEYKAVSKLIKSMMKVFEGNSNQEAFNAMINEYMRSTNVFSAKEIKMIFNKNMVDSTVSFFERAKAFNSEMPLEDIGQAMRNVWIINMIQQLEDVPVNLTDSAFGYSMLYPYTDNYLDNGDIGDDEKKMTMLRFGKRLAGKALSPENDYENALFKLIGLVEGEFDRQEFPNVFNGMLAIHQAQLKSQQQQSGILMPYDSPLLECTFYKGGTSVLADAFFVSPNLTEEQILFYCHYGAVLQLCDDLQDVFEDENNGHQTIFSVQGPRPLDQLILKVLAFNERMVDKIDKTSWQGIYRACILMMIASACFPIRKRLTSPFFKALIQYAPISPRGMKKLKREVKKLKNLMKNEDKMNQVKQYVDGLVLDI